MFYSKYIIYMNVSLISFYHKLRSSLFFLHLACLHSLLNQIFHYILVKLLTPPPHPLKKNDSNGNSKTF